MEVKNYPGNLDADLTGPVYTRQKLIDELVMEMGGLTIDIELDPEHYDHAIDLALDKYRQRSSNSVEEKFVFLELQPDQQHYYLPREVTEVRQILRRGTGTMTGGSQIDPFATAHTNLYLKDAGRQGGLLSFELFSGFQKIAGMMFGREITFQFDRVSRRISVDRLVHAPETVMLWIFTFRPEVEIFNDQYARPWIRSFALASCKLMLAMAYGKFQQIVGPQGGTSLPADSLKSEAQQELEKLEEEIKTFITGDTPLGFLLG